MEKLLKISTLAMLVLFSVTNAIAQNNYYEDDAGLCEISEEAAMYYGKDTPIIVTKVKNGVRSKVTRNNEEPLPTVICISSATGYYRFLKDSLCLIKGVQSVTMQKKETECLVRVIYKGTSEALWNQVPGIFKSSMQLNEIVKGSINVTVSEGLYVTVAENK